MLASVYSYRVMVKSVSSCCVRGRRVLSNPVTYGFGDHPEARYNMDETGMPLEPCPPKVVAKKGQKKVRYQTSGRKQQIIIIGCGSATGYVIPPFIVFAAKQVNYLWIRNEVSGSRFAVSDNGWVDHELFSFSHEEFHRKSCATSPTTVVIRWSQYTF